MIWVEQPVGVGYSQGTPNITNEVELATEFRGFWKVCPLVHGLVELHICSSQLTLDPPHRTSSRPLNYKTGVSTLQESRMRAFTSRTSPTASLVLTTPSKLHAKVVTL